MICVCKGHLLLYFFVVQHYMHMYILDTCEQIKKLAQTCMNSSCKINKKKNVIKCQCKGKHLLLKRDIKRSMERSLFSPNSCFPPFFMPQSELLLLLLQSHSNKHTAGAANKKSHSCSSIFRVCSGLFTFRRTL